MIRVVAVGRIRVAPLRELVDDYATRIRRFATIEVTEVPDAGMEEEGRRLLAKAQGRPRIACDPGGEAITSQDMADLLGKHGSLSFLMGGPDGLSEEVRQGCQRILKLSDLTLPHELARLVLVEQIYRGFTILRGHPYHR